MSLGGGNGGYKSSSTSESGYASQQFAPAQIGGPTKKDFAFYREMTTGIYELMKEHVLRSIDVIDPQSQALIAKDTHAGLQGYEDKISGLADQLMMSLATNIQPDNLQRFPLDAFVEKSVQAIYDKGGSIYDFGTETYAKAKGIYDKPARSRNEIKVIVDANTQAIDAEFSSTRRNLQQQMTARKIDPNSAEGQAAEADALRGLYRSKEAAGRQILAGEVSERFQRQLSAISQMNAATGQMTAGAGVQAGAAGQAQQYVGQQAQRWLNQWGQKLNAQQIQQAGIATAMQAQQGAAGLQQQQYANAMQLANQPWQYLQGAAGYQGQIGSQFIGTYSGAGQASGWGSSQSSGTQPGANPWGGIIGGVLGAAGTIGGAMIGGPPGAAAGGAIGSFMPGTIMG